MTAQQLDFLADEILDFLFEGLTLDEVRAEVAHHGAANIAEAIQIVADAYCPARR